MKSFFSNIFPTTYFQQWILAYFKVFYFKNLSEVNSVAFPVPRTGPVLLSTASTQSSRSQHHYTIEKLGWDLVWAFLLFLTVLQTFFFFTFFFFKLSFNFFLLNSFCPRLKFSLDSLSWEKKAKQTLFVSFWKLFRHQGLGLD